MEAWIKFGPHMTDDFGPVPPTSEDTELNSVMCSYEQRVDFIIEIQEFMNGTIDFRCRTSTDSGNVTSEVIHVNVEPQGINGAFVFRK